MVKNFGMAILIAAAMSFFGSDALAEDPAHSSNNATVKVNWNKVVKNYIHALRSENAGVRQSAEYYFARYKDSKEWQMACIEPLITLLKNDESQEIRKIAARLLKETGDARGLQAVEQASKTDNSKEVVEFCLWLLADSEL